MKDKLNENLKYTFLSGTFLLSFIFFTVLISTILFIFKITITKCNIFIALSLSIILNILLAKKNNLNLIKSIITTILIPITIIILSILISSLYIDRSYDGNNYHKLTIGYLANDWNPVYEKVSDYNTKINNTDLKGIDDIWIEHYSMGIHIFDANIYRLTNNIETAKCINIISIFMLLLMTIPVIIKIFKNKIFSLLLIISLITLPTITSQSQTFYIDIEVYIFFYLLFDIFILFDHNIFNSKEEVFISYIMTLIIGINVKFSLFAYMGLYCLGYYIYYLFTKDKKFMINLTVVSTISVLIAVFVVGLSTYPKNYLDHGSLFYPLSGENKVDILKKQQPPSFDNTSPLYKFRESLFSRVSNSQFSTPKFKIPFSIYESELKNLQYYDLRISGNGVWYSGIFILSLIIIGLYLPRQYKKSKKLFYFLSIPLLITFILILCLNESWWARYFPQLHLVEFIALYLLFKENKKPIYIILFTLIIFNNSLVLYYSYKDTLSFTRKANNQFNYLSNNTDDTCNLSIYPYIYGSIYNLKDRYPNYKMKFVSKKNFNSEGYTSIMGYYMRWKCDNN